MTNPDLVKQFGGKLLNIYAGWLGAMTTSGVYSYDPESKRYTLPR